MNTFLETESKKKKKNESELNKCFFNLFHNMELNFKNIIYLRTSGPSTDNRITCHQWII
jgi:hypothetical protein